MRSKKKKKTKMAARDLRETWGKSGGENSSPKGKSGSPKWWGNKRKSMV